MPRKKKYDDPMDLVRDRWAAEDNPAKLSDGSLLVTYPDGSTRQTHPDGTIEHCTPEAAAVFRRARSRMDREEVRVAKLFADIAIIQAKRAAAEAKEEARWEKFFNEQ